MTKRIIAVVFAAAVAVGLAAAPAQADASAAGKPVGKVVVSKAGWEWGGGY